MYYIGEDSTWATVEDLYARFGDEYVDKLAIRRVWDVDSQMYVADESTEGKLRVISLALADAKALLKRKLQCLYSNVDYLDTYVFSAIKQWHIKLTIETLKMGGDCSACACNTDIDSYFACGSICSDDGMCLSSKKTFITVSEAVFCCERNCGCGCCS